FTSVDIGALTHCHSLNTPRHPSPRHVTPSLRRRRGPFGRPKPALQTSNLITKRDALPPWQTRSSWQAKVLNSKRATSSRNVTPYLRGRRGPLGRLKPELQTGNLITKRDA